MWQKIDDTRILALRPLIPPAILLEDFPVGENWSAFIAKSRRELSAIFAAADDRLAVVVGPCSIHDPAAALDYARQLKPHADRLAGELLIVMRVYFEKPRTVVGWKGLINDPYLDNSFQINKGLKIARNLLLDITKTGLPIATEFLDVIMPQFTADLVSWAAIGARTTESQVHRELASGLSMPVGFKNGTGGGIQPAVDAILSARHPHWFPSVTKQGVAAIFATTGNAATHLILRGGKTGPNYDAPSVADAVALLERANLSNPRLMVDCSHANSNKDYRRQPVVADNLAQQIAGGDRHLAGVMMESNLVAGRQDYVKGQAVYGQSITDACISLDQTVPLLEQFAEAVHQRRTR
ncbi:MAG: 3-deoxy-7-phosphoheptulonate synthase [Verrucomicrobiales bacterium]|jgi:3-deoxy-7-phosphoheptulonate synthase|nr:3-deoxy-7-phosphoheptulonate synthase [Verrucomicrobiales bacterium]